MATRKAAPMPAFTAADIATIEALVGSEVRYLIDTYKATGNAAHLWLAWSMLRDANRGAPQVRLEVQAEVMALVDELARDAVRAHGEDAAKERRRRELVADIWREACRVNGQRPTLGTKPVLGREALERLSRRHSQRPKTIAMAWSRWWKSQPTDADRGDMLANALKAWNPRSR